MHFWHVQRKRSWIITGKGEHRACTHGDYLFLCHPFKEKESQNIKYEKWLKDRTYVGAVDNSDMQKPDLWFHLIIAKRKNQTNFIWLSQKASVSVAATDSWSRGQSFLTGSATLRLGRGGFRTVNSISFQFATVFVSVGLLYFAHFTPGMYCMYDVLKGWLPAPGEGW